MAGGEKKNGGRFLRWPWNVVIYVLLAVVLRLFAIPFILLLMWYQRKNNPHGGAEGYCLSRTRKRFTWLIWSLLMLVIAVALGAVFYVGLGQDRAYWETMDYVTLVISGGGAVLLLLLGFYLGYVALRDTFFPEKSALAQSIRSQLPYPDEAPPVEELFAMVDKDLEENGQWFGPIGIGREWVLGDSVTRIDRIRGIFTVDEIHQHHTQTGTRTRRELELVLIDDRWQRAGTSFQNPKDMQAAADCLALRVPDAARGKKGDSTDFWTLDESEREEFEREFRQRQSLRASERAQREAAQDVSQDMILCSHGERTSRVTPDLVEEHLRRCLSAEESDFELTPTRPIEGGGRTFCSLHCYDQTEAEGDPEVLILLELAPSEGERNLALAMAADARRAKEILQGWLRREVPDLSGWTLRRVYAAPQRVQPKGQQRTQERSLQLVLATGASESHTTFTQEDVEVAAEGIVDGTYQMVSLNLTGGMWIRVDAGDKSDARCTVRATRPDLDKLRFFEARTTPRQAAEWLTGYYDRSFQPGGPEWKDYTKQVEKDLK